MPDDNNLPGVTPTQTHQQAGQAISDQLSTALGEQHQTIPTTAESDPGVDDNLINQVGEIKDRVVLGKPGHEPAKSWLKKLFKRQQEKNPDSDVKLEEKKAA